MPVFHHPRTVIVDEGGSGLAAVAGVIALAVVVSSAAALIEDVLTAILITMLALALAGTGVLAVILRRDGLRLWQPPALAPPPVPQLPAAAAQALSAPPRAIAAPKAVSRLPVTGDAPAGRET